MEKLHLSNNTYQVWEEGTIWFQGTEDECDAYIQMNSFAKIPELSDEEIDDIAHSNMDLMKDEIWAFAEGMKAYREQLKQKQ